MATSNRSAERYKYGICLNDECPMCKSKTIQQVPMRKDLVCSNPECGKPLRECPPPKSGPNWKLIGGIATGVVVLGVGMTAIFGGFGGKTKSVPTDSLGIDTPVVVPVDTPDVKEPAANPEPQKPQPPAPAPQPQPKPRTPKYDFATFDGTTMVFTAAHTIPGTDKVAQPGDKVTGEWKDGEVNFVRWYHDGKSETLTHK